MAKTCPAHARVSGLEPEAGRLSAPLRHALIALCLYCVTGDEPSPEVLTRLLESNRKSIRIALPQGTGDPLHTAFEIVQQLALQGHPVPLNLLLLRKAFLTLDGIHADDERRARPQTHGSRRMNIEEPGLDTDKVNTLEAPSICTRLKDRSR